MSSHQWRSSPSRAVVSTPLTSSTGGDGGESAWVGATLGVASTPPHSLSPPLKSSVHNAQGAVSGPMYFASAKLSLSVCPSTTRVTVLSREQGGAQMPSSVAPPCGVAQSWGAYISSSVDGVAGIARSGVSPGVLPRKSRHRFASCWSPRRSALWEIVILTYIQSVWVYGFISCVSLFIERTSPLASTKSSTRKPARLAII